MRSIWSVSGTVFASACRFRFLVTDVPDGDCWIGDETSLVDDGVGNVALLCSDGGTGRAAVELVLGCGVSVTTKEVSETPVESLLFLRAVFRRFCVPGVPLIMSTRDVLEIGVEVVVAGCV